MSVRLTEDAATVVRATLIDGLPLTRAGMNEACRNNRLLGLPDGKAVNIAVRAIDRIGVNATIALAHADIDFRPDDHYDDREPWRRAETVRCPECGDERAVEARHAVDGRYGGYYCRRSPGGEPHRPRMMVPAR